MSYESKYIAIAPHCALKRLEEPCLYDIANDALYEINQEAYQFLLKCSQCEDAVLKQKDAEFIRYCLTENLITLGQKATFGSDTPVKKNGIPDQLAKGPPSAPIPSLRY